MELYQLRSLVTVAAERHLTRAAERLHISQPAVSAHIKALETELGAVLFDRTPTGMVVTAAGRPLVERAREVLAAADTLRRAARGLQTEIAGRLRLGTLTDPGLIRLGDLLTRTVARYPLLDLELHQEMSGAALEGVRDGRLHASFYFGDEPEPEIATVALRPVVYRVTAPIAWKDRVEGADWSGITTLPWVVTPTTSTHNRLVSRLFDEHGVQRPLDHIEADNEAVIESLVVSGVGVSLMREERVGERLAAGEICLWGPARLDTTLWFIYPRAHAADPLIRALLEVLRETWADDSAPAEAIAEAPQLAPARVD
jgi:DNA-binding transcriptional LysR family regulator